jgi:hypothetical protein
MSTSPVAEVRQHAVSVAKDLANRVVREARARPIAVAATALTAMAALAGVIFAARRKAG